MVKEKYRREERKEGIARKDEQLRVVVPFRQWMFT